MVSLSGVFFHRNGLLNLIFAQMLHHTHADAVGQHVDDGPEAISARAREGGPEVRSSPQPQMCKTKVRLLHYPVDRKDDRIAFEGKPD